MSELKQKEIFEKKTYLNNSVIFQPKTNKNGNDTQ